MGAGEKDFLNVGLWPGKGIDVGLVFVRLSRPLSPFNLIVLILTGGIAVVGDLGVGFLDLGFPTSAEGWEEFDTALIERQGMTEVQDGIVRTGKRQVLGDQTDRLHGVPGEKVRRGELIGGAGNIPHANKLDPDVDGKSSLKLHAQLETLFVIPGVHGVRKRQLFDVAWREKSDFLEHASEGTSGESTTGETENANSIPNVI